MAFAHSQELATKAPPGNLGKQPHDIPSRPRRRTRSSVPSFAGKVWTRRASMSDGLGSSWAFEKVWRATFARLVPINELPRCPFIGSHGISPL